jgi:general secretion pathway protein M
MTYAPFLKNLSWVKEKTGYDQLEPREKLFVAFGVVFLFSFLLFQVIVAPYFTARQRLARSVNVKKAELAKIVELQGQYQRLQGIGNDGSVGLAGHKADFSLFSFVEEQAIKADVKKQMLSMRPLTSSTESTSQGSSVEVKLQKVSLGRLVAFLKLIEDPGKMVFVHNISIKDNPKGNFVDVIMQIATAVK